MKTAAVIAEYNPFHNGHAYHIRQTRMAGYTHIVAIMSGHFVQRGSPAIADKFLRAETAIMGGVDLVVELPLPWCCSAAQDFASGGVQIAKAMGVVEALSFGCECDDLQIINMATEKLNDGELQKLIKENLHDGLSYPNAISNALHSAGEMQILEFISKPNNLLAFEYCKFLIGTHILPLPIRRIGCDHDSDVANGEFCSASYMRENVYRKYYAELELYNLYNQTPKEIASRFSGAFKDQLFPLDLNKFDVAALSRLRLLSPEELSKLPFVSDGLENRLYSAIQQSTSLEEACDMAKSKNVTHARIRRTLLCGILGISADVMCNMPYIRILAMNEKGKEVLKAMRKNASVPVIMKHSDAKYLNEQGKRVYDINMKAGDLYSLCMPSPRRCGTDAFSQIYIE